MSQVNTNAIYDASGGSAAKLYGPSMRYGGTAFVNRIINGDMRISQRGVTISSGIGVLTYTLDRWTVAAAGAAVSVSAAADPTAPYTSYMGITGAVGNTVVGIRQRIEWLNTADLAGQSVTVSFYCYNATGNATSATVQLNYPTAKDNYTSTTSSATQTINLTGTSTTRQSFTFTVPAAASNGIELNIFAYALTSGVLVLREVQLEAGSVASPFERRDYGRELMMCQRYLPCYNATSASAQTVCSGFAATSTIIRAIYPLKVNPRVPPTGVVISSAAHFNFGGAGTAPSAITFESGSIDACSMLVATTGATANAASYLYSTSASAQIQFTGCEL